MPYVRNVHFSDGDRRQSRSAGSAGPAESKPDPAERLLGLDILIVEDEAMLALDLSLSMEDAGAEVIGPAYSLSSAMALVSEPDFRADAAILDVDLSGKDVFPVADKLHAMGIPIIFNTGHGDRKHLSSMFPGAAVCMKPTLVNDLIERLEALLASRRP